MTANAQRILVVTPTLGESAFLEQTVASVAAQSVNVAHVISAPAAKLPELERRFPLTLVVPDAGRSGGIYGALNVALTAVPDGWQWFTYINDDDALRPEFSRMFLRHAGSTARTQVAYGDVDLVDEAGRRVSRVTTETNPAWIPALLQGGVSPLMQQGTLFHRETVRRLGSFDTRYRLCADLDFWLRAYAGGAGFGHYAMRVAQFRIRSGQLSGDTTMTECEQEEIVRRHLPQALPAWKKRIARWRYRVRNLPRYLERARTHGFVTSYELLRGEGGAR